MQPPQLGLAQGRGAVFGDLSGQTGIGEVTDADVTTVLSIWQPLNSTFLYDCPLEAISDCKSLAFSMPVYSLSTFTVFSVCCALLAEHSFVWGASPRLTELLFEANLMNKGTRRALIAHIKDTPMPSGKTGLPGGLDGWQAAQAFASALGATLESKRKHAYRTSSKIIASRVSRSIWLSIKSVHQGGMPYAEARQKAVDTFRGIWWPESVEAFYGRPAWSGGQRAGAFGRVNIPKLSPENTHEAIPLWLGFARAMVTVPNTPDGIIVWMRQWRADRHRSEMAYRAGLVQIMWAAWQQGRGGALWSLVESYDLSSRAPGGGRP